MVKKRGKLVLACKRSRFDDVGMRVPSEAIVKDRGRGEVGSTELIKGTGTWKGGSS